MYFAKALVLCASLVASTIAQSNSQRIAFTVLPSSITAGTDVTLHWGGGDGSPVTLTLQQGTTDNLKTVLLVNGAATGTSYTWSVPKNLPNGDNYALRIQQGDTEPNYTGMITVTGGSASSASSSASATATTTSSSSGSGAIVGGGSGSNSSSAAQNSTVIATVSANATTTVIAGTGTAASASGTGFSLARNTTMSKATLSATSSSGGATSTSSNSAVGGSGGTPTGSATAGAATPSKTGGAVTLVASNFALLVCAVVGVIYLG